MDIGRVKCATVPYEADLIHALAARHGLSDEVAPMPRGGMVNEAWAIGEGHVLRIVMEGGEAECDSEAAREAAIVSVVVESGVTTPRLVAFGTADEFAPRPYTIYERAVGELMGYRDEPIEHFFPALYQIGRETFLINQTSVPEETVAILRRNLPHNPQKWVDRTLAAGAISTVEADDVLETVSYLIEVGGSPPPERLTHCDLHPWNVMVDPASGDLTAIIDWGDATWGDPAVEFAAMPFECFDALFQGYRDAGGVIDRAYVARLLVQSVNCSLWEMREPAMANFSRRWWRTPAGGLPEIKSKIESVLSKY